MKDFPASLTCNGELFAPIEDRLGKLLHDYLSEVGREEVISAQDYAQSAQSLRLDRSWGTLL